MKTPFLSLIASGACVAAIFCVPQTTLADTTTPATNNATVQPGGPRAGDNGKVFFNMEGSSNDTFASFGVVDFQLPDGSTFNPGDLLSITLTQANASFTSDGMLAFYVSTDTTTDIEPDTSPLAFDPTDLPTGLGNQLDTKYLLGCGAFTQVADGSMDTFSFMPTDEALSYLMNEISTTGLIRVIVAPADPTVAATYAGFSNTEFQGPALTLTAAPSTRVVPTRNSVQRP
jgi:hypothetical protein